MNKPMLDNYKKALKTLDEAMVKPPAILLNVMVLFKDSNIALRFLGNRQKSFRTP